MDDTVEMPHRTALPFKAVMFDLDDTLIVSTIDFMKFRVRLMAYLKEMGADMSKYSINETAVSMISKFERELRSMGADDEKIGSSLDEIDSRLNEIELEKIGDTRAAPGAVELLKLLRNEEVRTGVLTRGSPEYARRALKIAGLTDLVDAVIARDRASGIAPKPSPESAFALAKKLGVTVDDSIMVGDFSIDFVCAKDSGMRFFGIASDDESRKSLEGCGCETILTGLDELRMKLGL